MRRALPILGFGLTLCFIPMFTSPATMPRWALLSAFVPLILLATPISGATRAHWLLLATLAWSACSLFWMDVPLDGIHGLWLMLILCGVFCLGAEAQDVKPTLKAMSIAMTLTVPLEIAQIYGWDVFPQTAVPGGLFLQANVAAELCAALTIACIYMRSWALLPGLLTGLVISQSRGALLMLAAGLTVYAWQNRRSITRVMWLGSAAAFLALTLSFATFTGTKLSAYAESSTSVRLAIWQDTLAGMTWAGNGIGSFWTAYPKQANHLDTAEQRSEYAHNEALHYAFELGIGVLFLTAALWWLIAGAPGHELELGVLAAILAGSLVAFPLHMPSTGFVAALVAGRLARARYVHEHPLRGSRDIYPARDVQTAPSERGVGGLAHCDGGVSVGSQFTQASGHVVGGGS